jgi:AraC-like DNA-binding protein
MPAPFICHLGFACIATPVLTESGAHFTLAVGPYCPAEEPRSLGADAIAGLARLEGGAPEAFPVPLDDIHIAPAGAIPAIIEWTTEVLDASWRQTAALESEAAPSETDDPEARPGRGRRKPHPVLPDPYQAAPIAAALTGGQQGEARTLLRGVLSESRSAERVRLAVTRARTVTVAAAVLEAAERSHAPGGTGGSNRCWTRFPEFVATVQRARTQPDLVDAAMSLLSILKREAARETVAEGYAELNAIVLEHLVDGITLNEVAARLGQNPTAITHRLQRKFGMSYSEYVGRLRIDKAKEYLRRTHLSVTEVARRVGIQDSSNFTKLFRKFEATSPLDYREEFGRTR